jgi:hypothetical protein
VTETGPLRQDHRTAIERWLSQGAPDAFTPELEGAWTGLLAALPEESPSADFAALVMLRAAGLRRPARDLSPRLRLAAAACLALVGLFVLALPALLLAFPLPVGGGIDVLASAIKFGAAWTAQGLAVWGFLANVARMAAVVLATPQATAFLVVFALLSAAGLRLLFELTPPDRRTAHASAR